MDKNDLITLHYPCGCEYDLLSWAKLVIDDEENTRLCPDHNKEYEDKSHKQ